MDEREFEKERRKQKRLERLGNDEPICTLCGENDDRCLEQHHIAGRAFDDGEATVCRNCHRKLSDDQRDHPPMLETQPSSLECIGHFLIGLADLFRLLANKLMEFGHQLVGLAQEMLSASGETTLRSPV